MPDFSAAFVDGEFFVQSGYHFADAGFGEALGAGGVGLLQLLEALREVAQFSLGFFVFGWRCDHSEISTSPLRRLSDSRVREKNSNQPFQSTSSSAAKSSSISAGEEHLFQF
jgi:hypothetical protein